MLSNFSNWKKDGQAWGTDLIVGFTIFAVALTIFYIYALNYPTTDDEVSQELEFEAALIGDSLMSEGSPSDWDSSNVVRIGILSDGVIDGVKLGEFSNMVENNGEYEKTKQLFNVGQDYYVDFSDAAIGDVGDETILGSNPENLVKVLRVSAYNGNPITLSIYVAD